MLLLIMNWFSLNAANDSFEGSVIMVTLQNIRPRSVYLDLKSMSDSYNMAVLYFNSGDYTSARLLFNACYRYCCNLLHNCILFLDGCEIKEFIQFKTDSLELANICGSVFN